MRQSATLLITPTGILNITLTPSPTRAYVGGAVYAPVNWAVDGSGGGLADLTIDWGDGTPLDSIDGVYPPYTFGAHNYASPGDKVITVSVDAYERGVAGQKTATIQIRNILAVTLAADKQTGVVPLAVAFTCGLSGGFPNYPWTMDYGDGSPIDSGTATTDPSSVPRSHTYQKIGSFTATWTVTDDLGVTFLITIPVIGGLIDQIIAWWNNLTPLQKALAASGIITGIAVPTIYVAHKKRMIRL